MAVLELMLTLSSQSSTGLCLWNAWIKGLHHYCLTTYIFLTITCSNLYNVICVCVYIYMFVYIHIYLYVCIHIQLVLDYHMVCSLPEKTISSTEHFLVAYSSLCMGEVLWAFPYPLQYVYFYL